MNNKKILLGVMLGLIFTAVNCFAEGLSIKNPYKDNLQIRIDSCSSSSIENTAESGCYAFTTSADWDDARGRVIYKIGKQVDKIVVSVEFQDTKKQDKKKKLGLAQTLKEIGNIAKGGTSQFTQVIDKNKFKANEGGTHGIKVYKKDFLVDGKKAWVEYALNVEFGEDPIKGKVLETLEVIILDALIPGVEKTDL